jgi:hypothetical protein
MDFEIDHFSRDGQAQATSPPRPAMVDLGPLLRLGGGSPISSPRWPPAKFLPGTGNQRMHYPDPGCPTLQRLWAT